MDFNRPQNILGLSDCFKACRDGLVQAILSEEDEGRRVVLREQAEKQEPQNVLQPWSFLVTFLYQDKKVTGVRGNAPFKSDKPLRIAKRETENERYRHKIQRHN